MKWTTNENCKRHPFQNGKEKWINIIVVNCRIIHIILLYIYVHVWEIWNHIHSKLAAVFVYKIICGLYVDFFVWFLFLPTLRQTLHYSESEKVVTNIFIVFLFWWL